MYNSYNVVVLARRVRGVLICLDLCVNLCCVGVVVRAVCFFGLTCNLGVYALYKLCLNLSLYIYFNNNALIAVSAGYASVITILCIYTI